MQNDAPDKTWVDEPVSASGDLLLALLIHTVSRRPTEWIMVAELLGMFDIPLSHFPDLERDIQLLEENGLIDTMEPNESILKTFMKVTLPGRSYAGRTCGNQTDLVILRHGFSPPVRIIDEIPPANRFDSGAWTGNEPRKFNDPRFIEDITRRLRALDRDIDDSELSNIEKACAKSVSRALLALIESPNPEWRAIIELLRSPAFSISVSLLGLTQFILGMLH